MPIQDLMAAMKMFKDGAQDLAASRAISQANEHVQQVKASEMSEAQKRAELTNLSSQLVSHLAMNNVPATTIQAVAGQMGPKQYANSSQMYADAKLTNNPTLASYAGEVQDFENDPKFELKKLGAAMHVNRLNDPTYMMKVEQAKDQFNVKEFAKFSERLDPNKEVRSSFGRAAQGLQATNKIEALIGKAAYSLKEANKLPPEMAQEIATGVAGVVKSGTPTAHEIHAWAPNTRGMDEARLKQYVTNELQGANAGQWIQLYAKGMKRERAELQYEVDRTILQRAQGQFSLYKNDPQLFKRTLADRLGLAEEDIVVDPKKRLVTTVHHQKMDEEVLNTHKVIREAWLARKSSDPKKQEMAARVFQQLKIDPSNASLKQALEDTKYKITRGLME
jgi:hypothetical protein